VAAVGAGGFAFHEHHEKEETKEEEEESQGKKHHHLFGWKEKTRPQPWMDLFRSSVFIN
jgi:hypothetical protein